MIKHYVEFFYPGIIVDESSSREVAERTVEGLKWPQYAHSAHFYSREETEGEHGTMHGPAFDRSPFYHRQGKLYTVEDVEREFPSERILIQNMRSNQIKYVIRHPEGLWREFRDGDQICTV